MEKTLARAVAAASRKMVASRDTSMTHRKVVAKELLRLAREIVGAKEVPFEELKGAIQFSPKYGGINFWVQASPGAILKRGPHGADYFREVRWQDRVQELRLGDATQEVRDAFSNFGGNHGKLIRELTKTKDFKIKKIAGTIGLGLPRKQE